MEKITTEDMSAAEVWDFPDINLVGKEVVKQTAQANFGQQFKGLLAGKEMVLEEARKEAFALGHQEGLEQGKTEGIEIAKKAATEKFEQDYQNKIHTLQEVIQQLQDPFLLVTKEVEASLLNLVNKLVSRLAGEQLETQPEKIKQLIQDAKSFIPVGRKVHIHLNPVTLEQLKSMDIENENDIFVADNKLEKAEVKIINEVTEVDATLGRRISKLLDHPAEKREPHEDITK